MRGAMKATEMQSLTISRLKELLEYSPETGIFTWKLFRGNKTTKGSVAGSHDSNRHIQIRVDMHIYSSHRLAWLYIHEAWPTHHIDHINGIRDDNRICNLREATPRQNAQNKRVSPSSNKSSGLLGVTWRKKECKWRAQINVSGKKKLLGEFNTKEEAHAAYITAKRKYHEFCTI